MDDLSFAIASEPIPTESYWFRHQLYLKQDNYADALKDIDAIIALNPSHYGASLAKARMFSEQGLSRPAIAQYGHCIKLKPTDSAPFFERALLFEQEEVCDSGGD